MKSSTIGAAALGVAVVVAGGWWAGGVAAFGKSAAAAASPSAPVATAVRLAPRDDVVSWEVLARAETKVVDHKATVEFPESVRVLDRQRIRLQGFIFPITAGETHKHFLLSAAPSDCGFCLPGGPNAYVEVKLTEAVRFTTEPVVLQGRMQLEHASASGSFYSLGDAVAIR